MLKGIAFTSAAAFLTGINLLSATGLNAQDDHLHQSIQLSEAGKNEQAIAALTDSLAMGKDVYQKALLNRHFEQSGFRDLDGFREALRAAAIAHEVHELRLVRDDEPGERIWIDAKVVNAEGAAVPKAVVYIFSTDDEGRYHPTRDDERLPRIFGTVVTDKEGQVRVQIVLPGPYPGTRLARHIHFNIQAEGLRLAKPGYAVFDDDPLLNEPQNAEQAGEAIRIKMKDNDEMRRGSLTIPLK